MLGKELQRAEYKLLCQATQDAVRLASAGDVHAGNMCLLAGLCRVCEFAEAGEEWAGDLADDYRRALADYSRLFEGPRPIPLAGPAKKPCVNPRYNRPSYLRRHRL
jgi:hypothetical protein